MSDQDAISRVLTLVFTDLADSTALKTQRGDAAIASLISRHTAHVKRLAADCGGRIIDWAGDGCFLTFETSSSAVLFALRLQQAHAEESELPGVRIGIHMGEVTVSSNEDGAPRVAGLAVDLAARISGLARPGQVLMSAAVYDSARQRIGVESLGQPILWQAHGTYSLKGFDKELEIGEAGMKDIAPLTAPTSGDKAKLVRRAKHPAAHAKQTGIAWKSARRFMPLTVGAVLLIALLSVVYLARQFKTEMATPAPTASDPNAPIKSLAVLPLDNLSSRGEQDYFADSMTEAITAELGKIKALQVRGRTTAMQYKDSALSIPEIAQALKVDAVIEGSVTRVDDEVRITVQLIHGASDTHLWTEAYTETITNVLKLQSDVALAIADAIKAEVTGEERARIATTREVAPRAHDAFLLGEHFLGVKTEEGLSTAIRYFEEAARIDPEFAEAWAGLGDANASMPGWALGPAGEYYPKARDAFRRALAIDNELPRAHAGLAYVAMGYDYDWSQAEAGFLQALHFGPNDAVSHARYAWYLRAVGRTDEALEHAATALDLDPVDPGVVRTANSVLLASAGQAERVRRSMETLLSSQPDYIPALDTLAAAYMTLGMYPEAIAAREREIAAAGAGADGRRLRLVVPLARAGREAEAEELLDGILRAGGPIDAAQLGVAHLSLGRLDAACAAFERGFEQRNQMTGQLRFIPYRSSRIDDPTMIAFRTDPRYRELIERMKFPPLPPDHPGYADEQAWLAKKKAAADANAPITKIAVLPFKNISGDAQQEFFVDGMTEALISELVKIKSIKVISHPSVIQYKDTVKTAPEIARELGVQGLIAGSAMKAGNEVRISAQLIRAATDDHLWADSYTEPLENVLKVQAKVALAITTEINAVVTPDERSRVSAAKTVNIAAYELYIQARHHSSLRTPEGFRLARELFTKSLEIDPNFVLGHVGLAEMYFVLVDYHLMPSAEGYRLSREEAEEALALDPAAGEAYSALGMVELGQNWDWKAAEQALLRSIELSPNYAMGHYWYANFLSAAGRRSEAQEEFRLAFQLDPVSPVPAVTYASILARTGQMEEAIQLAERFAGQYPDNSRILMGVSQTYLGAGRYQDALIAADRMAVAEGNKTIAAVLKAIALARLGRSGEARKLIEDTISTPDASRSWPVQFARVYALLGDQDRAIELLTQAVEIRDLLAWRVKVFSEFDALEGDPRYQALLRRMNFPEAGARN